MSSGLIHPDQLVELQLERLSIPILRALDHEDHQKRHDRGTGIDDELPGIRPAEQRACCAPKDDAQARHRECDGMTELTLGPAREAVKNRSHRFWWIARWGALAGDSLVGAIFAPLIEER